jgi:hypothetical protein
MKKQELNQLMRIVETMVQKEIRKQLPVLIAETFRNMVGKQIISDQHKSTSVPIEESESPTVDDTRLSLKELFSEDPAVNTPDPRPQPAKQYTTNPILNKILNETTPDLRQRERMMGGSAMMAGYSPSVSMADPSPDVMVDNSDIPSLSRMPSPMGELPIKRVSPLVENRGNDQIPMANIPLGVSVLDVARQIPLQAPVAKALTRNYSAMMKLIDTKKAKK